MWGKKKIMLICSPSPTSCSSLLLNDWSCVLQLARCQGTIMTFSVSPLAKPLMHVLLLPSSFCLSLQHQPRLHMWETLKCECSMMWPNSHVENFVFLFSPCDSCLHPQHPSPIRLMSISFSLFLITLLSVIRLTPLPLLCDICRWPDIPKSMTNVLP